MTTTKQPKKPKHVTDRTLRAVFWARVIGLMDADFDCEGLWEDIAHVSGDPEYENAVPKELDDRYRAIAGAIIGRLVRAHPQADMLFPRYGVRRR